MEKPRLELASANVTRQRRRVTEMLHTLAIISTLTAFVCWVVALPNMEVLWLAATAAAAIAAITSASAALRMRGPPSRAGEIAATDGALVVRWGSETLSIARASIASAAVVFDQAGHHWTLEVEDRVGNRIRAALSSADEGERFLEQAGFPAIAAVATVRFTSWAHQIVRFVGLWFVMCLALAVCIAVLIGIVGALGVPVGGLLSLLAWLVWSIATLALAWRCLPRVLIVGADGVSLRKIAKQTYIPYSTLARIEVTQDHKGPYSLKLWTTHNVMHQIDATPPYESAATRAADLIAVRVRAHIRSALASHEALERRGRRLDVWREALAQLTTTRAVFRDWALGHEALAEIVEAPAAAPEQRLAAAIALAGSDATSCTRVRVAIDACANEALREVLVRALDGSLNDNHLVRFEAQGLRTSTAGVH